MKIKDFTKGLDLVGYFVVGDITEKMIKGGPRAGNSYIDMTLKDNSGFINAKVWDLANITGEAPVRGNIVKVDAYVNDYNGTLQLIVRKLRKATQDDDYDLQAIVPSAPYEPEAMFQLLGTYIKKIQDTELKIAVTEIIDKYRDKLLTHPAAKQNHHATVGGLLHHITTMLRAAEKLSAIYPVKTDYLYAGIILHDIGKLHELHSDATLATEYTIEGELLGHIAIGIRIVERTELEPEKKLILQHMILSHHQNPEWGSPKKPMTKEAEMLSILDLLDFRMDAFANSLAQTTDGSISGKIYSLDRKIYNRAAI